MLGLGVGSGDRVCEVWAVRAYTYRYKGSETYDFFVMGEGG